jgi:hypothetical protein
MNQFTRGLSAVVTSGIVSTTIEFKAVVTAENEATDRAA